MLAGCAKVNSSTPNKLQDHNIIFIRDGTIYGVFPQVSANYRTHFRAPSDAARADLSPHPPKPSLSNTFPLTRTFFSDRPRTFLTMLGRAAFSKTQSARRRLKTGASSKPCTSSACLL